MDELSNCREFKELFALAVNVFKLLVEVSIDDSF
jgi:hypothetical protein